MKNSIIILITFSLVLSITGCKKDFDSLEKDQNRATSVPPNLVLNGILIDLTQKAFNPTQRWNQFYCCNYNYYGDQEYKWTGVSFNNYTYLNNVLRMEEEAVKNIPAPNAYTALGKFLRAYLYYGVTMQVGDIPLSEALKGLDNTKPKYDNQKAVFKQILVWLDEANNEIAAVTSKGTYILASDFYYNNDLNKWRKAVNSLKLRVLIHLSKHENDGDLNIKQKFNETLADPAKYPLFTGMNDNMTFSPNTQYDKYPTNLDIYGLDVNRYNMSSTYLNTLISNNDPRTFVVAEPADSLVRAGASPTSFAAFNGAGSGEDLATMTTKALSGLYSYINRNRYYRTYTAENTIQIGYPEMCFNIAEAINRGWAAGNAEDWYTKGIQASIGFYGLVTGSNTVTFQKKNGTINDYNTFTINFDWNTFYAQSSVKYAGNSPVGLSQILTQKYLAFYQNSGAEAYFNWRRTNVPTFHVGPGTGNSQRVPLRFQYPASEKAVNTANVNAAISAQFGGGDDINEKMWLIK
ncbi:MAG: SusD/RagB family nutrient-binding outer membrane lipoprotein [Bacteroidia bacterium]